MPAKSKPQQAPKVGTHPARPVAGRPDIKAMHKDISKRYPKVLSELAK